MLVILSAKLRIPQQIFIKFMAIFIAGNTV